MISLLIGGMSMLFVGLSGAYLYSRFHNGSAVVPVPWLFYANTIVIVSSSLILERARVAFDQDHTNNYLKSLIAGFLISAAFLILQVIAWYLMVMQGLAIESTQSVSYLFLIPMLHFLHVLGGLPFLFSLIMDVRRNVKDPAGELVFFSDPDRKRKLRMVTVYWHFVDVLWIYLVLFFTINHLI
jgi:cytochrome c oxidase subunit 3